MIDRATLVNGLLRGPMLDSSHAVQSRAALFDNRGITMEKPSMAFFVVSWGIDKTELHGPFGDDLEGARAWALAEDLLDPDEACIVQMPTWPVLVKEES